MPNIQPFVKKKICYKFGDKELWFWVSQELFSSTHVDHGTQRLLRSLQFEKIPYTKILDLGCGYGPIGISLKSSSPDVMVQMVDRDALAVEFTRLNCKENDIFKIDVNGSLGFFSVKDHDFDLIVSNIPAKVGDSVLKHMLLGAYPYLLKSGVVAVVVIDEIAAVTAEILNDDAVEILYHRQWPGHHVYHYRFIDDPNIHSTSDLSLYLRDKVSFEIGNSKFDVDTAYHLPEFDQLNYATNLLIKGMKKIRNDVDRGGLMTVFNPGQGYIPLVVSKLFNPENMELVDRNLLALEVSQFNLLKHDVEPRSIVCHHQISVCQRDSSLICGVIPEKFSVEQCDWLVAQLAKFLQVEGKAVLSSSSTVMSRVLMSVKDNASLSLVKQFKNKGKSVVILTHIS